MASDGLWLTTARLGLRRFTPGDLDFLAGLYADPDVTLHLGGPKDRAQTETILRERVLDYYDRHPGLGTWVTVERATGTPVGFHLLNHIQGETIEQVGYTLAKAWWGRGYATEMARAVLRYGFEELALPRISAIANLGNTASHHVLEKIGLRRNGERAFPHPAYAAQGPMAWFELDREDWLADPEIQANLGTDTAWGLYV
jgi:RimJ/RimL family protein N-acetyltransferase